MLGIFSFLLVMTLLRLYQRNIHETNILSFKPIEIQAEAVTRKVVHANAIEQDDRNRYGNRPQEFREVHGQKWLGDRQMTSEVQIYDHQGKSIGIKEMNFESDAYAPNFRLVDYRDGNYEAVGKLPDRKFKVEYRRRSSSVLRQKVVRPKYTAVIDAGFEAYIQDHWQQLLLAKEHTVSFAIPAQLDFFTVEIRFLKKLTFREKPAVMFELSPSNFLLNIFIKPIRLVFDQKQRKLLEYNGPYSFYGEDGEGFRVKVNYFRK